MAANDGEQALALLQADAYDLVLTDLFMPGMSGWTLLETIRERFATLLITGSGVPADSERAEAEGGVLLHKPVHLHELQGAVERALEWSRTRSDVGINSSTLV